MQRSIGIQIEKELNKHKITMIIGQRQVGKTTELKKLLSLPNARYIDFEDERMRALLQTASVSDLEMIFGARTEERLLLLDEIQYLTKAGSHLKLLHDHFPHTKIIATGSASFLLLKNAGDSLYGRYTLHYMFPLTIREVVGSGHDTNFGIGTFQDINKKPMVDAFLESALIYGSLPDIFFRKDVQEKEKMLDLYVQTLLLKDVFEIEGIRKPEVFRKLLALLAWQIGQEVNVSELATQLEVSRSLVNEYIGLYEKFQIIYRVPCWHTNLRNEVTGGFKIFFTDLGIRNGVIGQFAPLDRRQDTGQLFENLVMNQFYANIHTFVPKYGMYFWRKYSGSEVDLVLTSSDTNLLVPIEIKYSKNTLPSKSFLEQYKERITTPHVINKDNLWKYI